MFELTLVRLKNKVSQWIEFHGISCHGFPAILSPSMYPRANRRDPRATYSRLVRSSETREKESREWSTAPVRWPRCAGGNRIGQPKHGRHRNRGNYCLRAKRDRNFTLVKKSLRRALDQMVFSRVSRAWDVFIPSLTHGARYSVPAT